MMRPGQKADLRSLPLESQRAFEILETLHAHKDERDRILSAAGAPGPLTDVSVGRIAALYAALDMPLDQRGLQRFKDERGLVGGTGIGLPVALAYARALDGDEVLIRVGRADEQALTGSEKATLAFLRTFQKKRSARDLRPLKEALGLKNPPTTQAALQLANEVIGPTGIREIAKASAMHGVPLGPDLAIRLTQKLRALAPPRKS